MKNKWLDEVYYEMHPEERQAVYIRREEAGRIKEIMKTINRESLSGKPVIELGNEMERPHVMIWHGQEYLISEELLQLIGEESTLITTQNNYRESMRRLQEDFPKDQERIVQRALEMKMPKRLDGASEEAVLATVKRNFVVAKS